jgi:hypothetical protein
MKKLLPYLLFAVVVFACRQGGDQPQPDPAQPETYVKAEYADWYTFHSPANVMVEGVWGDRDKTLLIAGFSSIHRSVDGGKTWTMTLNNHPAYGITMSKDTLFSLTGKATLFGPQGQRSVLSTPGVFSTDDGKSWKPYAGRQPTLVGDAITNGVAFDPIMASNGTSYAIRPIADQSNQIPRSDLISVTVNGLRTVDLPNAHRLSSLYLDPKGRLYVVGSAALCGNAFCQPQTTQSVVYISKRPLP